MADRDDAAAAAHEWLALLDSGDYQACWEGGSALLRGAVSPGQLAKSLRSALEPMGAPQSRSLDGADYHETLPGAPDGRYWVIRFSASYGRKQAATETVTASWDDDAWRVSGYFIR
ncbi:MAG: DUF4019 domain-containing protein [Spirochaetaceae bacterium]|nr:DUF4019 domain-containing protein [Spirochaetaceae bacterium]